MFKVIIPAIVATLSLSAQASSIYQDSLINLKSSQSSQTWRIDYPGQISGVCGVSLKTSSDLWLSPKQRAALADALVITDDFFIGSPQAGEDRALSPVKGEQRLDWIFISQGTFVTNVQVKTVSGKSLKSTVDKIIGGNDSAVLLQALSCDDIAVEK